MACEIRLPTEGAAPRDHLLICSNSICRIYILAPPLPFVHHRDGSKKLVDGSPPAQGKPRAYFDEGARTRSPSSCHRPPWTASMEESSFQPKQPGCNAGELGNGKMPSATGARLNLNLALDLLFTGEADHLSHTHAGRQSRRIEEREGAETRRWSRLSEQD